MDTTLYQRTEEEESQLGQKNGAKFDTGKNRYDLVSFASVEELARNYAIMRVIVEKQGLGGLYNKALFHARRFWNGEDYYLKTTQHNIILSTRYFFELIVLEGKIIEAKNLTTPLEYNDDYRYDLIPPTVLDEVVKIYTYGTIKYDDNNWRKGMKWGKVYGALERHAVAWRRGEIVDKESGFHHLCHSIWNCLALREYSIFDAGEDDRYRYQKEDIEQIKKE